MSGRRLNIILHNMYNGGVQISNKTISRVIIKNEKKTVIRDYFFLFTGYILDVSVQVLVDSMYINKKIMSIDRIIMSFSQEI